MAPSSPDTLGELRDYPANKDWRPDHYLGEEFQYATFDQGRDPDGEGDVFATVVRHLPQQFREPTRGFNRGKPTENWLKRPAILWIHGYSDYFFQEHVAEGFTAAGYAFYALDLRKCGRSHRPRQKWNYVTSLELYFPDITAAASAIVDHHPSVVPLAHSNGGLSTVLWGYALSHAFDPQLRALQQRIPAVMLNSPWLGMPVPAAVMPIARALQASIGRFFPRTLLSLGSKPGVYGQSLSRRFHGEWAFAHALKPMGGQPKYFGWLRAAWVGIEKVKKEVRLPVPVLTLCSQHSQLLQPYSEKSQRSDTVLNVEDLKKVGAKLSNDATVVALNGALHDVFLSSMPIREHALEACLDFLAGHSL